MTKFLTEPTASMSLGNTCAGCSTHKHEDGFVNTNLDILGRGRVYFCAGCVREMAHELGGIDKYQLHALHGQLDEMGSALEAAQEVAVNARKALEEPFAVVYDFMKEKARIEAQREAKPVKAS